MKFYFHPDAEEKTLAEQITTSACLPRPLSGPGPAGRDVLGPTLILVVV